MSHEGPRLRRTKDGYAYAKFNGQKLHFGRYDDPQARVRFAALKARWEANDRELTDDMMPARMRPGAVSVDQLCDLYEAHLKERHDATWQRNNLDKIKLSLDAVRDLYGPEAAATFSPKRSQAVRLRMIDKKKLCYREINERVRIIRAAFTWGVAEELCARRTATSRSRRGRHGWCNSAPLRAGDSHA